VSIGAFVLALWVALGLQQGLAPVLRLGDGGVTPSFVLPLLVFVGLFAPVRSATGAAAAAGMVIDLLSPVTLPGGGTAVIPGPHAMGLTLAMQLVLGARGLLYLNSPVTLVVLTPAAGAVAQVVVTAIMSARELYDPAGFRAPAELGVRVLSALYSAGPALVLWFPLRWTGPWWRFESPHAARWSTRR
jgi:cell shape-determining protein MreD